MNRYRQVPSEPAREQGQCREEFKLDVQSQIFLLVLETSNPFLFQGFCARCFSWLEPFAPVYLYCSLLLPTQVSPQMTLQ